MKTLTAKPQVLWICQKAVLFREDVPTVWIFVKKKNLLCLNWNPVTILPVIYLIKTEDRQYEKNDLIHGNIAKALLLFVLPLIAGSLIQQLYTTADAIIVGQFTGKSGLAAIDSVHTLFKFPINFMNGLATGATIMISGYFGAKDKKVCTAQYALHF